MFPRRQAHGRDPLRHETFADRKGDSILPIVVALALTMLVSAVVDVTNGRTTSISEAHHVLEVAGLVLVWMLAGRPVPRRFRPLIHHPGSRRHFRHA